MDGCVIPAHPLALTETRHLDTRHQRALTRYYLAAGAGGLAVGVHSTQFAIHDPKVGLYRPVLETAAHVAHDHVEQGGSEPILIAGIVGQTAQALREAEWARDLGYHLGLLSLTALAGRSNEELIDHARQVANVIPLMGFYLQPTISGMILDRAFWQAFLRIANVLAIKIAPFDRYKTLDVLHAVAESGRAGEVALYTGNDDTIMQDLLTTYTFEVNGESVSMRMVGGLLGQWACWTERAVALLDRVKEIHREQRAIPATLLTLAGQLTLANQAIFDAANAFAGCIPGISYVLHRQGLMDGVYTLDPEEALSPGQAEAIDRIMMDYPHLTDDAFVRRNLERLLAD